MRDFGEFNIEPTTKGLKGEHIKIDQLLNVNIIVEGFQVVPSKFKEKGPRLDLQLIYKDVQRMTWVSSKSLIEMIEQVPKNGFPFKAKIVKEDSGRLVFKSADK